jgi:hypothetical protein
MPINPEPSKTKWSPKSEKAQRWHRTRTNSQIHSGFLGISKKEELIGLF